MAAAKPASPPPTIAILIPAAIAVAQTSVCDSLLLNNNDKLKFVLHDPGDQPSGLNKCNRRVDANREQKQSDRDACVTGQALCPFADRDAPINQEQPNTIREMPHGCGYSDHIDDKDADVMKLPRDYFK